MNVNAHLPPAWVRNHSCSQPVRVRIISYIRLLLGTLTKGDTNYRLPKNKKYFIQTEIGCAAVLKMWGVWNVVNEVPIITIFSIGLLFLIGIFIFATTSSFRFSKQSPKPTNDTLPLLGSVGFFTRRWDFTRTSRDRTATRNFSFWVGKLPVIGLGGDDGRVTFFEERGLDFGQGYGALFGQGPNSTSNENINLDKEFSGPGGYFQRRIVRMLKKENFDASECFRDELSRMSF